MQYLKTYLSRLGRASLMNLGRGLAQLLFQGEPRHEAAVALNRVIAEIAHQRSADQRNRDLAQIAASVQRMTREIDPRWGLKDVAPFTEIEDRSLVVERLVAQTSAAFGALAVLVASIVPRRCALAIVP